MWIPIIVLAFTIALIVGPVMWLRPPAYERQAAARRTRAAQLGLQVRLVSLADYDNVIKADASHIPFYQLAWNRSIDEEKQITKNDDVNHWTLLRSTMDHEIHFHGVWKWHKTRVPQHLPLTHLHQFISELPEDIAALECTPYGIAVGWWERGNLSRVATIKTLLENFKQACVADFKQAAPQLLDE